ALVRLPSEAQHERASSWPIVAGERVDPRWKQLFAWESRKRDDPAALSLDEPLATFAALSPDRERAPLELELAVLQELVRKTSRSVGDRSLEMLFGFQWEWTRDRLSDLEPDYSQLDRAEKLGPEHEATLAGESAPLPVTRWCGSGRGSWFAARGGPP